MMLNKERGQTQGGEQMCTSSSRDSLSSFQFLSVYYYVGLVVQTDRIQNCPILEATWGVDGRRTLKINVSTKNGVFCNLEIWPLATWL